MDPIDIADSVLAMIRGMILVIFSSAFGVAITTRNLSLNIASSCIVRSYEVISILASLLVLFSVVSLLLAAVIKSLHHRHTAAARANPPHIVWKLVYILCPCASISYVLALLFYLATIQIRLGKIKCWTVGIRTFNICFSVVYLVGGFSVAFICYIYRRAEERRSYHRRCCPGGRYACPGGRYTCRSGCYQCRGGRYIYLGGSG